MGDISRPAVRTITLKPASAKTFLPIPVAQECSASAVNLRDRLKQDRLCETCKLFKKFQLEGEYFCL